MEIIHVVTGFEHGSTNFFSTTGTVSVQTATVRSGTYALRLQPAGAANYVEWGYDSSATGGDPGHRLYVRFATPPNQNFVIAGMTQTGGFRVVAGIAFNASTTKFRPVVYDDNAATYYYGNDHSGSINTNVWYRVEFKNTPAASNGETITWYIDGVAGDTFTQTGLTVHSVPANIILGDKYNSGSATAGDIFYDDVLVATTTLGGWPEWPYGAGKVIGLFPVSDGTHSTAGDFTDDLGNSPPASVFDRLDDVPAPSSTGDHVYQDTINTGSYLEVNLTNRPADFEDLFNGAVLRCGTFAAGVGADVNVSVKVRDTVNNQDLATVTERVRDGTMREMTNDLVTVNPETTGNTGAVLDGLTIRAGFSSDVTPNLQVEYAMLELDYATDRAGEGWGWGDGQERWHYM